MSYKTKNRLTAVYIIIVVLAIAKHSFGAEYDLKYTDKSGKEVTPIQAFINAQRGETVYKCQTVEAKPSKSGTSLSLRNVKKPSVK